MNQNHGAGAYVRLLAANWAFALILLGEVINQIGNWFTYVATMELVKRLAGGGSGVLIAGVIIARMLPTAVMFPLAGAVADRFNRVVVLFCACLAAAAAGAGLVAVRLMYVLLAAQSTMESFYDPARRALTSELVPRDQLHLAATLDGFAWSVCAAVGAAVGGVAVSALGTRTCFFIDAGTYVGAACCALLVWTAAERAAKAAAAANGGGSRRDPRLSREDSSSEQHASLPVDVSPPCRAGSSSFRRMSSDSWGLSGCAAENGSAPQRAQRSPSAREALIRERQASGVWGGTASEEDTAAAEALQRVSALKEGWRYISAAENRDVASFALIKASGGLLWGASDVLYVKFADVPSMQVHDSATSLGIIYGAMGAGAVVGPLLFNVFVPSQRCHLLRAVAIAFSTLLAGYLLFAEAPSIAYLLPSIVVRSGGASVLWTYSTLLLQLEADNAFQGRVFALEMAAYVVAQTGSSLWGGYMFDDLRLSPRGVSLLMIAPSAVVTAAWATFAWRKWDAAAAAAATSDSSADALSSDRDHEAAAPLLGGRSSGALAA